MPANTMTLNPTTINAILADVAEANASHQQNQPHVIGHNETSEDADLAASIGRRGGAVLSRSVMADDRALCIHYRSPEGTERWAYVIKHRMDVDAFGEESLICSAPAYNNHADLVEAICLARAARQDEGRALLARLSAVDVKWSAVWLADLGFAPRALPWLLKDGKRIAYARQVRDAGPEVILTWPDETPLEVQAKRDVRAAVAEGLPIAESGPARTMAALIALYSAAGIL